MATTGNHKHVLLLVLVSVVVGLCQSYIITLDDIEDQGTGVWTTISCRHYYDFSDYVNATGCTADEISINDTSDHRWMPEDLDEDFLGEQVGVWGPCSTKTCELVYYGGFLPQPKNISISGLFSGNGKITIAARRSASTGSWHDLGTLTASDTGNTTYVEWIDWVFESSDFDTKDYVFRFTVTTTGEDSLALIDRIEIDLGDDVPEPPPPTTSPPTGIAKKEFVLDLKEDLKVDAEWKAATCNYIERYEDFWVYGCPNEISLVDNEEDEASLGYWTTCHAFECDFIFSPGIDRSQIEVLTIEGYFQKDARVSVSTKSRRLGAKYQHLMTISADDFSNNTASVKILPNECGHDFYNISIFGHPSNVIVNKITVELYDDSTPCEKPDPTKTTTTTTSTTRKPGTGTGDNSTPPTEGDKDGVEAIKATFMTTAFVVFISLSVYIQG